MCDGIYKWQNDNRKRRSSFDFNFFLFRFCGRSACPVLRIFREALNNPRCSRSTRRLRVVSPFGFFLSVWTGFFGYSLLHNLSLKII